MSDTDGSRVDPRVIRRLNVIIALLVLPYVLFAIDRSGRILVQLVVAAVLVFGVVSVWYAIAPAQS